MQLNSKNELVSAIHAGNIAELSRALKGKDINQIDEHGNSLLHHSCWSGNVEITKLLLESGIDINKTNEEGNSSLHWAAYKSFTEIVKLLIALKGDSININIANKVIKQHS